MFRRSVLFATAQVSHVNEDEFNGVSRLCTSVCSGFNGDAHSARFAKIAPRMGLNHCFAVDIKTD